MIRHTFGLCLGRQRCFLRGRHGPGGGEDCASRAVGPETHRATCGVAGLRAGLARLALVLAAGWMSAAAAAVVAAVPADDVPPPAEPIPQTVEIADGPFEPTLESLAKYECPEWFQDAKLGIWAVWGPEAVPEQGDWYARNMYREGHRQYKYHVEHYGHPSEFGYKDVIPLWKAEKWDPDRLMTLYKKAGAKYFCAIANHHDNVDCWDSRYHRWNSVTMGPKRDVVGQWKKAAEKHGLRFGVTEHLGASWAWFGVSKAADTKGPKAGVPYDGADPKFADLYHTGNTGAKGWYPTNTPESWKREWFHRIKDLVDRYQPDLLYSDGTLPYGEVGRHLLAHFYNTNARAHGGRLEAVYACKRKSDGGTYPEGACVEDLERGVLEDIKAEPWQTDTCVGGWYYHRGRDYKSAATVLHMLADIVSKNGNLLLNFPLRPDGSLDDAEEKILAEMAAWMDVNAEAIFGTRPWKVYGEGPTRTSGRHFNERGLRYTPRDIRFTTRGGTLYAIALGWPQDGRLLVRSLGRPAEGAQGTVNDVRLLGHDGDLKWSHGTEGLVVTLPEKKPCDHALVLKIAGQDLQPAPLARAIHPGKDGRIVLRARDATTHGGSPRYEVGGGKDNVGYWHDPKDYVSWDFVAAKAGTYDVQVTYSCAKGAAGSRFVVAAGGEAITATSTETGSWATFTTRELGTLRIREAGPSTLTVRPETPPAWKVIGLRSIVLSPTKP